MTVYSQFCLLQKKKTKTKRIQDFWNARLKIRNVRYYRLSLINKSICKSFIYGKFVLSKFPLKNINFSTFRLNRTSTHFVLLSLKRKKLVTAPGSQPALDFGGANFMNFHSMTSSCLFNRDTTFSQTVTDMFFSQHFRK